MFLFGNRCRFLRFVVAAITALAATTAAPMAPHPHIGNPSLSFFEVAVSDFLPEAAVDAGKGEVLPLFSEVIEMPVER